MRLKAFEMQSMLVITVEVIGLKINCPECKRPLYIGKPLVTGEDLVKAYVFHSDKHGCNPDRLHFELMTRTIPEADMG
jgi:hypothetical protein